MTNRIPSLVTVRRAEWPAPTPQQHNGMHGLQFQVLAGIMAIVLMCLRVARFPAKFFEDAKQRFS